MHFDFHLFGNSYIFFECLLSFVLRDSFELQPITFVQFQSLPTCSKRQQNEQPYRERVINPNSLGFVAKTMILDLVVLRVQKQAFN